MRPVIKEKRMKGDKWLTYSLLKICLKIYLGNVLRPDQVNDHTSMRRRCTALQC